MQRRSPRLAASSQFYLVITGRGERSSWPDAGVKRTGYLNGIIVAQVPCEAVHPFICRNCLRSLDAIRPFRRLFALFFLFAGKVPDDFARSIQNVERDLVFGRSLEIVINNRARRRIIADWLTPVEFFRIMQTHSGLRLIKNRISLERLRAELAQRRDVVQHPERTAMSCYDQIVVLYNQIVNR